jgi:hypothetical protein
MTHTGRFIFKPDSRLGKQAYEYIRKWTFISPDQISGQSERKDLINPAGDAGKSIWRWQSQTP